MPDAIEKGVAGYCSGRPERAKGQGPAGDQDADGRTGHLRKGFGIRRNGTQGIAFEGWWRREERRPKAEKGRPTQTGGCQTWRGSRGNRSGQSIVFVRLNELFQFTSCGRCIG